MAGRTWSREETLMALAFYLCPPSGRKSWDDIDPEVQALARALHRTEGSICFKLGNLKACDPNRTGSGFSRTAHMDTQVMNEYLADPDGTMDEALAQLSRVGLGISFDSSGDDTPSLTIADATPARESADQREKNASRTRRDSAGKAIPSIPSKGLERETITKERINQGYFRRILLFNYGGTCCLTGLSEPALLTASHIKPWARASERERLMPSNGLLLNALHDRAFDRGLITLDDDYRVVVSRTLPHTEENDRWLYAFDGEKIHLPGPKSSYTWPSLDFIHYHNDCVFESRR